jgi:putative redox protein
MPEGVAVEYPLEVEWEGGMRWRGAAPGGEPLLLDGERNAAPSPVDAMLLALASCAGIDVVDYLEKRRTPATAARVAVRFSRAPAHPRRVTQAHLVFHVATETAREHVERAVRLSFDRYCSVAATFAPDTELGWEVELSEP